MDAEQGKDDAYARGFTAGYQRAKAEELEHYRAMVESGRQIYDRVIRGLIEVPSFAEREEARFAVLREAHAAELHVGRPVLDVPGRKGCPVCMEARAAAPCPLHEVGNPDNDVIVARWNRGMVCSAGESCRKRGLAPAHNGHYGVASGLCQHGYVPDGQACGESGCTEPHDCLIRDGRCLVKGHRVADEIVLGCSFHRERGDGHVPSCGACALVVQRAAGR